MRSRPWAIGGTCRLVDIIARYEKWTVGGGHVLKQFHLCWTTSGETTIEPYVEP